MIDNSKIINDLCQAFLEIKTAEEVYNFLKDLCTPAELDALAERWQICQSLDAGLSYREIHANQRVSLTTIGRVARCLKDEPYQGYINVLKKVKQKN